MKIGYARVSTLEQNLDLQLRALAKAGCKKIFREKASGSNRERPQFQRMLDQIRVGDTIIVWKLDRLARSTRELLEAMEAIREAGGRFQSLSEPWADTTTHAGKMIMTVFAGMAEFERDLRGCLKSLSRCETVENKACCSDVDKRLRSLHAVLVVPTQASIAAKPSEAALYNPGEACDLERTLPTFDDL